MARSTFAILLPTAEEVAKPAASDVIRKFSFSDTGIQELLAGENVSSLFHSYGDPVNAADLPEPTRQRLEQQPQYYRSVDPSIYVGMLLQFI